MNLFKLLLVNSSFENLTRAPLTPRPRITMSKPMYEIAKLKIPYAEGSNNSLEIIILTSKLNANLVNVNMLFEKIFLINIFSNSN